MIKKINILAVFFTIFSIFIFGLITPKAYAEDCELRNCEESDSTCLEDKISCIEDKLKTLNSERTTLNSTISVINGNINIQELKIQQTVAEINKLEKEVGLLGDRISGLSISLDRLTTLLVDRIRTQYKEKQNNPLTILIMSGSLNKFVNQYRYLTLASKQTAEAMQRAQYQRVFYDEQKDIKIDKQDEVETKRYQLQLEQNSLVGQRKEKNELLTVTKNDEQKFQELLEQAETQLSSFRRFIDFQGGASILQGQTNCDDWGCYYNQRDSKWGSQAIGNSNSSMAEYGCLVTSMAMVASHYGRSLDPGQIASSANPFWLSTAYMKLGSAWSVNGVSMTRTRIGYGSGAIDGELNSGRPVIVGIGSGPDHFLVIKSKEDGSYIMRDPFTENGKDIHFTDKYSVSSISTVDRVVVN